MFLGQYMKNTVELIKFACKQIYYCINSKSIVTTKNLFSAVSSKSGLHTDICQYANWTAKVSRPTFLGSMTMIKIF